MEIFFLIMIFIMGTVFGSFLTLAVYRIPLNKNITHERSFCPNCNHRLEFFDLIPILSYVGLRGKCRYCGEKVRIRYLLLEVLSGIIFVLAYSSLNISIINIKWDLVIYYVSFVMFFITACLIAGIDKEHLKIDKRVLLFGLLMQIAYEMFKYFWNGYISISFFGTLIVIFVFFIIDTICLKKGESYYFNQILLFITYLLMCISYKVWFIFGIILAFFIISGYVYNKVKFNMLDKPDILREMPSRKLPIGFLAGISAILVTVISNFIFF